MSVVDCCDFVSVVCLVVLLFCLFGIRFTMFACFGFSFCYCCCVAGFVVGWSVSVLRFAGY